MKTFTIFGFAISTAAGSVLLLLAASGPARADHTHVKVVGNGECIVLAQGSGESHVDIPPAVFEGNPNVDIPEADGKTHPLHVLVHKGVPGDHLSLYVYGSPDALTACPGELQNH